MGCSTCAQRRAKKVSQPVAVATQKAEDLIATKSDSSTKVRLRYYGGGMAYQSSGCSACGTSGQYSLTTSETIQFPSDDAPQGWFSQRFDVGRDYYVTEKQAEMLLKETFTNGAGQQVNKFKVIE